MPNYILHQIASDILTLGLEGGKWVIRLNGDSVSFSGNYFSAKSFYDSCLDGLEKLNAKEQAA